MRLIDADALAKRMQYLIRLRTYDAFDCLNEIDAAPTIDAVPVDKIQFTDLYLDGIEAIAVFKFGNHGITLHKKCEDFAPVVHGRWEFVDDYTGRCTNCREENGMDWEDEDNYCPNCGAKMDGEADG